MKRPSRTLSTDRDQEQDTLLDRMHELARIGTWELDLEQNEVTWSLMTKRIHEVPPDFEPDLATGIQFYREGDSRRIIRECLDQAMKDNLPFDTELQLVTATGRNIWVRAIGHPVRVNGKCQRVHGMFQDIDQRKQGEERQLNFAILQAKAKEMEQFAYVASHDLREPLLTIAGFIDVIREDHAASLPPAVQDHLETIAAAAGRMDDLIAGLLDYSRLSAIKTKQPVDVNQIMEQVRTDLAIVIAQANAQLTHDELPDVLAYPLELKLLFQNLVGNAVKYRRPEVRPRIHISARATPTGHAFTVTDNGIGIPAHQLENVFQLFRQLHEKGEYAGSGIGLANVKKIVELHGGEITATSELGRGTTFHFTIND